MRDIKQNLKRLHLLGLAGLLPLLVSGCELVSDGVPRGPAPVGPVQRDSAAILKVNGSALEVTGAALATLSGYGAQAVEGTANRIRVPFARTNEVAICPPISVRVHRTRRLATADGGYVDLTMVPVADTEPPRTAVEIRLVGRYSASGNTGVLEAPCRSTGVVEQELRSVIVSS